MLRSDEHLRAVEYALFGTVHSRSTLDVHIALMCMLHRLTC